MHVLVNGRKVKEYSHKGMGFIESRHGTNYTIRLKNDNAFKVMAVLSVDGLDVITGKAAEKANKGYIIDGYSQTEIKGYRISDNNSAAFVFLSKGKSYVANVTGSRRNCGVIGVRVFKEKYVPTGNNITYVQPAPIYVYPQPYVYPYYPVYPWNPWYSGGYYYGSVSAAGGTSLSANINCCTTTTGNSNSLTLTSGGSYTSGAGSAMCMCSNSGDASQISGHDSGVSARASANAKEVDNASNAFDSPISYDKFDTGTGWGQKLDDKVKKEHFEKGDLLTELVTYYSTRESLIEMGLDLDQESRISHDELPQAFRTGYCQPPKQWVDKF